MISRFRSTDFIIISVLLLGTFALYLQSRHFAFLDYDDVMYVSGNSHIRSGWSLSNFHWALTDISSANWHPVTTLSYLALASIFGVTPEPFHLTNALLHSINVALLYVFLQRTTALRWQSFIVAALWGWHPQRAESVAWVAELKDVLCGLFWLTCMLAYVRYSEKRTVWRYAWVAILLTLSLLSKPMAVMLPFVLLLLDFWPLRVEWNRWRLLEKIPLALIVLATCAIAIYTQQHRGATGSRDEFPLAVRLENAVISYFSYISKTVVPRSLSVFYPHPRIIGTSIPIMHWLGAAIVLSAISLFVPKAARGCPYLLTGWFWFLITLVPVIGVLQVGDQAMADRYTYMPAIGLVWTLVWWAGDAVSTKRLLRRIVTVATVACLAALIVASYIEIGLWQDTKTIFAHADQVTEKNYMAKSTVAYAEMKTPGQEALALNLARSAVEICPDRPYQHEILAAILADQGMYKEAYIEYESALHMDPYNANTHSQFGGLLVKMGKDDQAMKHFVFAIHLNPSNIEARHDLAICLANHNRLDEAIEQWQQALRYDAGNGAVHGWLGEALRMRGDRAGAIEHYRAAVLAGEHNPDWQSNFAWLVANDPHASPADLEQAIKSATEACDETRRGKPGPLDALSLALARTGRFDDAIAAAQTAAGLADTQHQPGLAKTIRSRIDAYRTGHIFPSTEPSGGPSQ